MLRCQAIVTRIDAAKVVFRVVPQPACSSCEQGRGCGMALFEPKQTVQLTQPLARLYPQLREPMAPGQRVELAVAGEALLALCLREYLVPLVLALLCASLLAPWGDLPAALGLALGLASGYLVNRRSILGAAAGPDLTVIPGDLPEA